jgi:hypothetical protein
MIFSSSAFNRTAGVDEFFDQLCDPHSLGFVIKQFGRPNMRVTRTTFKIKFIFINPSLFEGGKRQIRQKPPFSNKISSVLP